MSMHYFSFLSGFVVDNIKSAPGHVTLNLCFCIQCDLQVIYYILVHLWHEMSMHYFHSRIEPVRNP
jgi:hypothetical protein